MWNPGCSSTIRPHVARLAGVVVATLTSSLMRWLMLLLLYFVVTVPANMADMENQQKTGTHHFLDL